MTSRRERAHVDGAGRETYRIADGDVSLTISFDWIPLSFACEPSSSASGDCRIDPSRGFDRTLTFRFRNVSIAYSGTGDYAAELGLDSASGALSFPKAQGTGTLSPQAFFWNNDAINLADRMASRVPSITRSEIQSLGICESWGDNTDLPWDFVSIQMASNDDGVTFSLGNEAFVSNYHGVTMGNQVRVSGQTREAGSFQVELNTNEDDSFVPGDHEAYHSDLKGGCAIYSSLIGKRNSALWSR